MRMENKISIFLLRVDIGGRAFFNTHPASMRASFWVNLSVLLCVNVFVYVRGKEREREWGKNTMCMGCTGWLNVWCDFKKFIWLSSYDYTWWSEVFFHILFVCERERPSFWAYRDWMTHDCVYLWSLFFIFDPSSIISLSPIPNRLKTFWNLFAYKRH